MIEKIIYLKFDELYLKGHNINTFKDRLITNLKEALYGFDFKINYLYDAIIINKLAQDKIDLIITIVTKIPGFSFCSIAYELERNVDLASQIIIHELKNTKTFKIEAKRSDKSYSLNSDQLKRTIAGNVLTNLKNIKVDVHQPEVRVNIDVKKKSFIIYFKKIPCTKGLPVGVNGKVLMLLSGGIDSPVASHMLMTRGMHVDFLVFVTPPFTENALINKIKNLVKLITFNYRLEKPTIYLCNFTNIQTELSHTSQEAYRITLLRRSFLRIANLVANTKHYDCIATGDALGQVASQTIESLKVIDNASNLLVLRPLIGFNKESIINYAKQINTYQESIVPLSDTCSLFAPKNPVTKPKLEITIKLEEHLDLIHDLELNACKNIEVITYDKK